MMRLSHELQFCYFSADQTNKISRFGKKVEFNKREKALSVSS